MTDKDMFKDVTYDSLSKQVDGDHYKTMKIQPARFINENNLPFEAFKEVGPGGHFFGCAHTMANYETAFHEQELADTDSYENWCDNGRLDSIQRANRHWKQVLADYEAPYLDPSIDEELQDFIKKRKASMPDIWH